MEITVIFTNKLSSFKYDNEYNSEYEKKLSNWDDNDYLYNKALDNNINLDLIDQFVDEIFADREFIRLEIKKGCENDHLYEIFVPLHNNSISCPKYEESKAKFFIPLKNRYKTRLSNLRLYALRIKNSYFIITGGAIKFSQTMQNHPDTKKELDNLSKCRNYLIELNTCEEDIIENSFYN